MTGAEHAHAAEEILARYAGRDPGNVPSVDIMLALVHACLAAAAEMARLHDAPQATASGGAS